MTVLKMTDQEFTVALNLIFRDSQDRHSFLTGFLKNILTKCGIRSGAIVVYDEVAMSPLLDSGEHLASFAELVPCTTIGKADWLKRLRPMVLGPPSSRSDSFECWVTLARAQFQSSLRARVLVVPMQSPTLFRGFLLLDPQDPQDEEELGDSLNVYLRDAAHMLEAVIERNLHRQTLELITHGLSIPPRSLALHMSEVLRYALPLLECEGLSFFTRDPFDENSDFRLVGTANRPLPSKPIIYESQDNTVTTHMLREGRPRVLHYIDENRANMTGFADPKWTDISDISQARSVLYIPVEQNSEIRALLRCTNPHPQSERQFFNALDMYRAKAFASSLVALCSAAEGEDRLHTSLQEFMHEINHNLNGILSCANYLRRNLCRNSSPDTTIKETHKISHICESVDTLKRLTQETGLASRGNRSAGLTADEQTPSIESFAPYADLCMPEVDKVEKKAKERNVSIAFAGKTQLGRIYADIGDFRSIAMNLIGNAVKYTMEGEEILIGFRRATKESPYAKIDVASKSLPIEEDEREEIFRNRYRSTAARSSGEPGDGIGLHIARSIARRYRGDVKLTVREDYNAFSVWIPMTLFIPPQRKEREGE